MDEKGNFLDGLKNFLLIEKRQKATRLNNKKQKRLISLTKGVNYYDLNEISLLKWKEKSPSKKFPFILR